MLDRPTSLQDRLRTTWPVPAIPDSAIEHVLRALALMPDGSHRLDAKAATRAAAHLGWAEQTRQRRARSYCSARMSSAF